MNQVALLGNLVKDPMYRESGSGVCRFTLAVADGFGENENTSYISIVVFGKQAISCSQYLAKGSQVCVSGRIQTGSYEKSNGEKVYTTDVVARRVEFCGKVKSEEQEPKGFSSLGEEEIPW